MTIDNQGGMRQDGSEALRALRELIAKWRGWANQDKASGNAVIEAEGRRTTTCADMLEEAAGRGK